jgi:benzoyl-CoA reductase/2-hydroxyglutaryl-CoA dehydratase subunit BcrC/BadD/HgdB
MAEELTLENLKALAERRGLRLPEDELQRLLTGVIRARRQAAELREMVAREDEPAAAFDAIRHEQNRRL